MARLFHPFLPIIASSTDRKLARQIVYLKDENKILRACLTSWSAAKCRSRLIVVVSSPMIVLGYSAENLLLVSRRCPRHECCHSNLLDARA